MKPACLTATIAALGCMLGACSSVPGSGPVSGAYKAGKTEPYVLLDLTEATAKVVADDVATHQPDAKLTLPAAEPIGRIGAGDLLQVAIWEPNPAGTSLTADKGAISLATRVGADGTISVPYIGRVAAKGHTPAQVENDMTARLAHTAPGAQTAVLVTEDVTNAVFLQGEVAKPGRYAVTPGAAGLLDVLAMAGGPRVTPYQTLVRITRGASTVTRPLAQLVRDAAARVDLAPGDRVLLLPHPASFYAFGAVNHPGEQPCDMDDMRLSRVLARLEGLADNRADPAAVFVYRRQDAALTAALTGRQASGSPAAQVIYRLNLRDPAGFFISQRFPVLPDDLLYVSDAPVAEAAKIFQIVNGLSSLGAIPRNLGAY